ncbi:ATP-binding protein [Coraliomargarita akajimensis]|uniref:histidine kinase n=1 Tax=Coraliomargarita akajimensis (strain DSM 45221 / IAM 15411 / JCM 23193 / KCTC 12865 / 04OKA010-24) TaxID=583355 RepID=D5ENL0_CORAD|nr:ATP-binding protein [Coraliomargarita akajimensis]ADE55486.1 histidine kinase [Coraliomargarita akajimensis DSM 45221]
MKLIDHSFIKSISEERRESIIAEIEILEPEVGATIFEEDSYPDALYVVLEGSVVFTKQKPDGSMQHVSQSYEGALFGEVGVFTEEHRALRAEAGPKAKLGRVPKSTVTKIIEDAEPVRKVLESVILHLKSTTSHYMEEVMRKEKLSLVGTMVSSLLHDFKNPFAIISLGATLVSQKYGEQDPKVAKICANIESQTRRMVDMANDIAAFARGDEAIEISNLTVESLFHSYRELNAPYFEDPQIELTLEHNDISLQADGGKLLRVLQNLISNSIEAIRNNKQAGVVKVSTTYTGTQVLLTISDNGPGIPESIQAKFFEPFVTFGKSDGTGLGTAIAKSIIDAHKGSIRFNTGPSGTTVLIELPRTQQISPYLPS